MTSLPLCPPPAPPGTYLPICANGFNPVTGGYAVLGGMDPLAALGVSLVLVGTALVFYFLGRRHRSK